MASASRIDLLDPFEVAQLGGLEIVAEGVVEGFLAGLHRSPFRGFSVEFAEHRPYGAGDELRYVDWRMLARSDKLFVKQYEEETNLRSMIVLDASASMNWSGTERRLTKLAYAKRLTAALTLVFLRQRDATGFIGFHTWKGSAEFWGFDEATTVATVSEERTQSFRGGWTRSGRGWRWGDDPKPNLIHADSAESEVINRNMNGIHGTWQCRVSPGSDSTAAMLFQVSPDAKAGFAAVLKTADGKVTPSLVDLEGQTLWTGSAMRHRAGAAYVVIATGMTDRVQVRVRSADGALLAESDQHYVSDKHNTRTGHLGFRAGGTVAFSDWSFKKEQ